MSPRVTVLMSVHNGARYLQEAIDSILAQTFRDFELLIIDDASTDQSPQILARHDDPRMRVLRNESNLGLTKSLNRGLAEARGELVARHDDDDRSHPKRLEEQVAFLDAHPETTVIGTQATVIDGTGRRRPGWLDTLRPTSPAAIRFALMMISPMIHGSVMFRCSVIRDDLGGYDEAYQTSQDFELWSRVATRTTMRNLNEVRLDLRVHANSVSANDYTCENLRRVEAVFRHNLTRITGDPVLSEEWSSLWIAITNPAAMGHPERAERALRLLNILKGKFLEREPEAQGDSGIALTCGIVHLVLASYLARRNRRYAALAFSRALHSTPGPALRAFPRLFVRLLPGGESVAGYLRRMLHHALPPSR